MGADLALAGTSHFSGGKLGICGPDMRLAFSRAFLPPRDLPWHPTLIVLMAVLLFQGSP